MDDLRVPGKENACSPSIRKTAEVGASTATLHINEKCEETTYRSVRVNATKAAFTLALNFPPALSPCSAANHTNSSVFLRIFCVPYGSTDQGRLYIRLSGSLAEPRLLGPVRARTAARRYIL